MADYGIDTDCVDDLPLRRAPASARRNLLNALARRLTNDRGALEELGDDADYGYNVRNLLHTRITDAVLAKANSDIGRECEKDVRVLTVDADITVLRPGTPASALSITLSITPDDDSAPFTGVVVVDELTTTAFLPGAQ